MWAGQSLLLFVAGHPAHSCRQWRSGSTHQLDIENLDLLCTDLHSGNKHIKLAVALSLSVSPVPCRQECTALPTNMCLT